MKNIKFLLISIIFLMSCKKDITEPVEPSEDHTEFSNKLICGSDCFRFQRQFYGAQTTACKRIKLSNDGGYLFSGRYVKDQLKKNFILKTNCFGETVSIIEVNSSLNFHISDFTEISSGGYMLICVLDSSTSTMSPILKNFLIRIDQNGDVVWDNLFGAGHLAFPQHIISLPNDEFLFTGFDVSGGGFVFKTNENGDNLWSLSLNNGKFFDLELKSNGNILLCGEQNEDIYVTELSSAGLVLWTKNIDKASLHNTTSSIEILNNEIFISGQSTISTGQMSSSFVMKLDASGNEMWYSTLQSGLLTKTHDGKILCVDKKVDQLSITKMEPINGQVIYQKTKAMIKPSIEDVKMTSDNGFILLGYEFIGSPPLHYFLLKTDENGN